jgi:hypothetical protein
LAVGDLVGNPVGDFEGAFVGDFEGAFVGAFVGADVGASDSQSQVLLMLLQLHVRSSTPQSLSL